MLDSIEIKVSDETKRVFDLIADFFDLIETETPFYKDGNLICFHSLMEGMSKEDATKLGEKYKDLSVNTGPWAGNYKDQLPMWTASLGRKSTP